MAKNTIIALDSRQRERFHELASMVEESTPEEVERLLEQLAMDGEDENVIEYVRFNAALPTPKAAPQEPPQLLNGRFRLEEEIGVGGMGSVYRAVQVSMGRQVAVKVITPGLTTAFAEKLFKDEIQALAQLEHPGIVRIYDSAVHHDEGAQRDTVYFAMELVSGVTLADRIGEGRMAEAAALALGRKLSAALHHAHDRDISHLDLKPGNIMLRDEGGEPVILDFGLAAIPGGDGAAGLCGTPAYMSPEQLGRELGRSPDIRLSDVYSLGCVLFECVCGERPHAIPDGATPGKIADIVRESPPRRLRDIDPAVSAETERVLHKAMRIHPRDRFQSAAELSRALEVALVALTGDGETDAIPFRPAAGAQIPSTDWVLDRKLGGGAAGEVWHGHHTDLPQERVFKFCPPGVSPRLLKRELTLFRGLAARCRDSSGFVQLYDIALETPPYYLMLEDVGGVDLARWGEGQGELGKAPLATRIAVVIRLAEILQVAHDAGVIHRDVKPANVLVAEGGTEPTLPEAPGRIFLTDFGIGEISMLSELGQGSEPLSALASLTAVGEGGQGSIGTPLYLAPEVHGDGHASPRSDIFALGVILYQLVVGDLTRSVTADWRAQVGDPLLADDIAACLATDPADRPAGASWLAERLRTLPERRASLQEREAEIRKRERRAYRKGLARAIVGAAAAAAILGYGVYALARSRDSESREALAQLRVLASSRQADAAAAGREILGALDGNYVDRDAFRDAGIAVLAKDGIAESGGGEVGAEIPAAPGDSDGLGERERSIPEGVEVADDGAISVAGGARLLRDTFPFSRVPDLLAFNADRTLLAAAGPDSFNVLVWDVAAGNLDSFFFVPGRVGAIDWGGSVDRIAVLGAMAPVSVWDLGRGRRDGERVVEPLYTVDAPLSGFVGMAYSAGGNALALLHESRRSVSIFRQMGTVQEVLPLESRAEGVTFSAEGEKISVSYPGAGSREFKRSSSAVAQRVVALPGSREIHFSGEGDTILSLTADRISAFDARSMAVLCSRDLGYGRVAATFGNAFILASRQGPLRVDLEAGAAEGGWQLVLNSAIDGSLGGGRFAIDLDTDSWVGEKAGRLVAASGEIPDESVVNVAFPLQDIAMATSGKAFLLLDARGTLHVLDNPAEPGVGARAVATGVTRFIPLRQDDQVAVISGNRLRVVGWKDGLQRWEAGLQSPFAGGLAVSEAGGIIATGNEGQSTVFRLDDGRRLMAIPAPGAVVDLDLTAAGDRLVTLDSGGALVHWDLGQLDDELARYALSWKTND